VLPSLTWFGLGVLRFLPRLVAAAVGEVDVAVRTVWWELRESLGVASDGATVDAGPSSATAPDSSPPIDSVSLVAAKVTRSLLAAWSSATGTRSGRAVCHPGFCLLVIAGLGRAPGCDDSEGLEG
jgi:hypothetical protein